MPTVDYTCYISSGNSNKDLATGASINESFSRSGNAPAAGSTVVSATLYMSSIRTYSTKGTYLSLGSYGTTNT